MAYDRLWHGMGGSTGYGEKVFPNKKVGHTVGFPTPRPGSTKNKFVHWRASLDGFHCGIAKDIREAQLMVESFYKEKYGS